MAPARRWGRFCRFRSCQIVAENGHTDVVAVAVAVAVAVVEGDSDVRNVLTVSTGRKRAGGGGWEVREEVEQDR